MKYLEDFLINFESEILFLNFQPHIAPVIKRIQTSFSLLCVLCFLLRAHLHIKYFLELEQLLHTLRTVVGYEVGEWQSSLFWNKNEL